MMVQDTLAEVEDDLAQGDHASARRRLRDALVTRPHRLDLRLRLAAVAGAGTRCAHAVLRFASADAGSSARRDG